MRYVAAVAVLAVLSVNPWPAEAHLAYKPNGESLEARERVQQRNLHHARYVCEKGTRKTKRWHCAALPWLERELRQTRAQLGTSLGPIAAIQQVFGAYAGQALAVARCESDYFPRDGVPDPHATNGQYLGMFQMGDYARSTYGHSWTAIGQARAAYRYFRAAGGWGPWECKP